VGVCVLVYVRTHTPTTWVLDVSPGVGRTPAPESRKNPDRLKRSIHEDHIGVQSTFFYTCAGLRVLMIWANCLCFFQHIFSFGKSRRCDDNQQTAVTIFSQNNRPHLESSKQNYYIISLWAIIKAIFTSLKKERKIVCFPKSSPQSHWKYARKCGPTVYCELEHVLLQWESVTSCDSVSWQ